MYCRGLLASEMAFYLWEQGNKTSTLRIQYLAHISKSIIMPGKVVFVLLISCNILSDDYDVKLPIQSGFSKLFPEARPKVVSRIYVNMVMSS